MPKREHSFDEHLSPQIKIHIGQKQVNSGVNQETEMSKVYEKTLNLLKNGSKEFNEKLTICDAHPKKISPLKHYENKSSHLKQMVFDSALKLHATEHDIELLDQKSCQSCLTSAAAAFTRCFYCNQFKCADCLKECTKCYESFCDKCSLIVYEGGEHSECLACYR